MILSSSIFRATLYFLAAGAACIGGPAIGSAFFRLGQQEAAASTLDREAASFVRLLQVQIDLAPLREQALAVGVDPDIVEQAYRNVRDALGHD